MDYEELAGKLRLCSFGRNYNLVDLERKSAANSITELLARVEAAEAALKREKSYDTPLPPFEEDDPDVLYCQKCGSGEYLENEDGNRNNYCGQCRQRIDWAAYDAAIEAISGTGGG